jgi:hypothetical protein
MTDDVKDLRERLARIHTETKVWPFVRNDPRAGADGYIHRCRKDAEVWPCLVARLLAAEVVPS